MPKPLLYDAVANKHREMADDEKLSVVNIPVASESAGSANFLTTAADGLQVKGADMVSGEAGNMLTLDAAGKLQVQCADVCIVSHDADNVLLKGTDDGVWLSAKTLVSEDPANVLVEQDNHLFISEQSISDIVVDGITNNPAVSDAVIQEIVKALVDDKSLIDALINLITSSAEVCDSTVECITNALGEDVGLRDAVTNVVVNSPDIENKVVEWVSDAITNNPTVANQIIELVKNNSQLTDAIIEQIVNELADSTKLVEAIVEALERLKLLPRVSVDQGNIITEGSDGGAYLSSTNAASSLVRNDDPLLKANGSVITSTLGVSYNQLSQELMVTGVDGKTVATTKIPLPEMTPGSLMTDMSVHDTQPVASGGEAVRGDYFVGLLFFSGNEYVDASRFVTTTSGTQGTATFAVAMTLPIDKAMVFASGDAGRELTPATSPSSATFADGSSVTVEFTQGSGVLSGTIKYTPVRKVSSGKFLHLAYVNPDKAVYSTYVDLSDLIDVYTAGDGITISGSDVVAVKAASTGGLQVDGDGVAVKVKAAGGLSTDATGASVRLVANRGLTLESGGVNTVIDSTGGLQVGASGFALKTASNGGLTTNTQGASLSLVANRGLTLGSGGLNTVVASNGGLQVNASGFALKTASNGGIVVSDSGAAVRVATTTSPGIMQVGAGLAVTSQGDVSVDVGSMSSSQIELMKKQLRVQTLLTQNTSFYVDGSLGSDTLDDGRGLSTSKPFKTIQACINYVCSTYNLYVYNATIRIKAGFTYSEYITIPNFSTVLGKLILNSYGSGEAIIEGGVVSYHYKGEVILDTGLTIRNSNTSHCTPGWIDTWYGAAQFGAGHLGINCSIDATYNKYYTYSYVVCCAEFGGTITIGGNTKLSGSCINFVQAFGGTINIIDSFTINGEVVDFGAVALARLGGKIIVFNSPQGIAPVISGTVNGRRHVVDYNGVIWSNSSGVNLFPGSIDGIVSNGGQFV